MRAGVAIAPCAIALAGLLLAGPSSAEARVQVWVGGAIGVPPYGYYAPYGYPYPYAYHPYPYYYAPPVYAYPAYPSVPPPGWEPGRWEWRRDAWGRPIQVWVPAHLR
jgi:hypothetical protein